jgi:hypothetical protein
MKLIFILSVTCLLQTAVAQEIVEVRRNIPLANDEAAVKDFYINSSLKKNTKLTAFRRLTVRDSTGAKSFGEMIVPVGELRVIASYSNVSVAREVKLISRENEAMLEQIGILVGDSVEASN